MPKTLTRAEKTAETLAKAAMWLRIDDAADWHHPLAAWFEAEAEDAARCPGESCPEFECDCEPVDIAASANAYAHHHCRFCRDDAPSLEVADGYLWSRPIGAN